jgi:hypothetical protein
MLDGRAEEGGELEEVLLEEVKDADGREDRLTSLAFGQIQRVGQLQHLAKVGCRDNLQQQIVELAWEVNGGRILTGLW